MTITRREYLLASTSAVVSSAAKPRGLASLKNATFEEVFRNPPASAGPWVYWMWLDGNVTPESVAIDLAAMHEVGIAGAYLFDVLQGTPAGPARFLDERWCAAFRAATETAQRLGMQLIFNNGAGYYGSGGPWITPELAMQIVVCGETRVVGGQHVEADLPRPHVPSDDPPVTPGYANVPYIKRFGTAGSDYRDIAVIAVRESATDGTARVDDPTGLKRLQWYEWDGYSGAGSAPKGAQVTHGTAPIPLDGIVDVSDCVRGGKLSWDAPAGEWTVLRIGHACKGRTIGPVREDVIGLESDKLNIAATRLHFDSMVRTLLAATGRVARGTVRALHIDSWEGGGQSWTPAMRSEFTRRRGYDPSPWLPAIATGRVLCDLEKTERFLWDLRQTVSELAVENYWRPMKRLANEAGLALSAESYTTTGSDIDASYAVDEPMAEFWNRAGGPFVGFANTVKLMASSAALRGKSIVAAEAFTSTDGERWLDHPGVLKSLGDRNLAKGVNRFVFHRFSAQRFGNLEPGLQMGPWGVHYEATQPWWPMTRPSHRYLARCQHVLRQGRRIADVLRLASEEPLLRAQDLPIEGYDYDHCSADELSKAHVLSNAIRFPAGARYRLLVLDHTGTMTLATLRRVAALVKAGGAVLGEPPEATPGLADCEAADQALRSLSHSLWGGNGDTDRRFGSGRVFRGISPAEALARLGVLPDLESDEPLAWMHRQDAGRDTYFIASDAAKPVLANLVLRQVGGRCELLDAERGTVTPWPYAAPTTDGRMRVCVPLTAGGSVFVSVCPGPDDRVIAIDHDGRTLYSSGRGGPGLLPLLAPSTAAALPGRYVIRTATRARDMVSCCWFRGHRDKVFLEPGGDDATTEVQPGVQA